MDIEIKAPHVYTAIAEVTGKLSKSGISKERKNTQQGYRFRGIDDVYNALSSVIAEAKLCLLPRVLSRSVTERETKNGGVLFYIVVDVDFDIVSAVDGSRHTVHVVGEAMDSADKATNKAMSAAYKYMAMQVFCIPTEGDNDADATTHELKPGIGVHSPMGEIQPPTAEVVAYADAYRAALAGLEVLDELGNPITVKSVHADLKNEGEETYRAVWSLLNSKERSAIKKLLDEKVAA